MSSTTTDQDSQASEDVQRALVAENKELRQRIAEVQEELVAEYDEHRIGQMKHHRCKEREEVLLSENQQLKEKIKQLSEGTLVSGFTSTQPSSNDCFISQLGLYLDQNRDAHPSNKQDTDTAVVVQAGEVARRRRSQSRSRRNSRSGWEPPPFFVEPNKRFSRESEECQGLAAHLSREVTPVWLHALFRDKQWKNFSEVVQLLDKASGPNSPLLSKMTEKALHTYVHSQEFQDNPQKLISLLHKAGCLRYLFRDSVSTKVLLRSTSVSIENRHSVPKTVRSLNGLQQLDEKMKRHSSSSCQ